MGTNRKPPSKFNRPSGRHRYRKRKRQSLEEPQQEGSDNEHNATSEDASGESTYEDCHGEDPVSTWTSQVHPEGIRLKIAQDKIRTGWSSQLSDEGIKVTLKCQEPEPDLSLQRDEYRIINMGQLANYIQDITLHAATCDLAEAIAADGDPPVCLTGVTSNKGLACILQSRCQGCDKEFTVRSSPFMNTPNGRHFEVNVRAVWGEAAAGGGQAKLSERLTTMGMPAMSGRHYI